jgi:hypothetical protein
MESSSATDDGSRPVSADDSQNDPFILAPATQHHRFSNFDAQVFALGPNASPAQAKRALEAHLAETDRRMEEAGKLGTALVQQRKELTDRLKEVEKQQADGEISEDLRQKLVDIEKDYNEVARESARAFLPKQRVPSNEAPPGSPFIPEGKGGRRSVSPSKFEAQATGSPTKLSVPNRKIRNQPSNRIHDIEFAAEISTSLIAQVRNLQGLLAEKEEELREVKVEKSKLEYEAQGFQQRVKTLDESEHRYKDENWNLETQLHELMAAQREAADREKKLTQALNVLQADKNSTQRELDETKLGFAKLTEDHTAAIKHHDIEIGTAKRNMALAETERSSLQKKIEELTGQNQELAKAYSSQRGRVLEREPLPGMSDEDFETANDNMTPEHSPPPSPIKGTPRHSMLESETLKTSLGHAQRTIQSLRTNYHREKTEKMELRRMLQDARDDLEKMRNDPMAANKRARKAESREFKKPPRLLGGLRSARSEIFAAEDPNWEDQPEASSPAQATPTSRAPSARFEVPEDSEEQFETANDTSDAAFETANERGTETDDFHTGAEEFSSEDDVQTETESPSRARTIRSRPSSFMTGITRSTSAHSTASTEDEAYFDGDSRMSVSTLTPLQQKFPLRVSRGAFRRGRQASEEPTLQSSPASFISSSGTGASQQPAQSLAAELGDFDGSDNESNLSATPSRRSLRGRTASPPPAVPPLPRVIMVDSAVMTDPVPELSTPSPTTIAGAQRPLSIDTVVHRLSTASSYSDAGTQDMQENLAKFPSPPSSPPKKDFSSVAELAFSNIHSETVEPEAQPDTHAAEMADLRSAHAKQVERITTEHASAMEVLRTEQAEQIKRLEVESVAAQAAALEALKAAHAGELSDAELSAKMAHAKEVELLNSTHAEQASRAAAEAHSAHAQEIAALRTTHAQELEALTSSHAEQASQSAAEAKAAHSEELSALKATHAQELETLALSHAEQASRSAADSRAAHAQELDALKATHTQELESLTSNHAEQTSRFADDRASYERNLDSLKTSHANMLASRESESKAALSAEIESLQAKHSDELSALKKDGESIHATEIAALIAAHATQIEDVKNQLTDAHASELDAVKARFEEQAKRAKQDADAAHAEQFESLKAGHQHELEELRKTIETTHAERLQGVTADHQRELEETRKTIEDTHAEKLDDLTANHQHELEELRKTIEAAHAERFQGLTADHQRELEESRKNDEATQAEKLEVLVADHQHELEELRKSLGATHVEELETRKDSHAKHVEDLKKEHEASLASALAALAATHAKELETSKVQGDAALSKELMSLRETHSQEIDSIRTQHTAAHAQELEGFKAALAKQVQSSQAEGDAAHTQALEALNAAHAEILEAHKRDSESSQSQALENLKASHAKHIDELKAEFDATRFKEREDLTSTHSKHVEELGVAHTAAIAKELDDLRSAHARALEELKAEHASSQARQLEDTSAAHDKAIDEVKADHVLSQSRQLEEIAATHSKSLQELKAEHAASKARELEEMATAHTKSLDELKAEHAASKARELEEMATAHTKSFDELKAEHTASESSKLDALAVAHSKVLDQTKADHSAAMSKELEQAAAAHAATVDQIKAEHAATKAKELQQLAAAHAKELETLKENNEASRGVLLADFTSRRSQELEGLRSELDTSKAKELAALEAAHSKAVETVEQRRDAAHQQELSTIRDEHEAALSRTLAALKSDLELKASKQLEQLRTEHAASLDSLRGQHQSALDDAISSLKNSHAGEVETISQRHNLERDGALEALKASHADQLAHLQTTSDEVLVKELEILKADHVAALRVEKEERAAERDQLLALHATELDALRASMTVATPTLSWSEVNEVETQPIESQEARGQRREAFIMGTEQPQTPLLGKRSKGTAATFIAEDETRQSPSALPSGPDTPESQRPFKELSTNTETRPGRKQISTTDQSAQTALTATALDRLLNPQDSAAPSADISDKASFSTIRLRQSHESIGSIAKARQRMGESGALSSSEPVPVRRPGSSASVRSSLQNRPPLPANHREAIEAARGHSSSGGKGSMGPPLLPASAYRNASTRPRTPSNHRPVSSQSGKGTPTPRAARSHSTSGGYGETHSPTRVPTRSRQSSVSSFASEIDTRFNIRGDMGFDASGFGPNTDPRMIQAITQTMIGEYLWKYTRKAGRGEMSEKRHRRYFWVHPYTRTLYWSDRDPSSAGRAELRAKSVPIEAVRVVTDDNPMPPGLHRKSLVIISPGRTVKFTCTTGQRHETWFNALSYLLLRTGTENQTDAEDMAGQITQEDVDEFNPGYGRRPANGHRVGGPPSLSSYNSRTTRNESPTVDMTIPTLTPSHERGPTRSGTLSRLSDYWRASTIGGSFGSRRGRGHTLNDNAIYEASEVRDSAEDLRQMIEQQDRESDRLENVRACCDGKHDVGSLPHTSKRGRLSNLHAHTHTHPGPSASSTPMGSLRSRA